MGKSAKFYKKKPKLGKCGEHGGGDGAAERYDKEEEVGAAAKARAMKARLAEEARQKRAKGPGSGAKKPVETYDEDDEDEDEGEEEVEEAGKQSIAKRPRGSGGAAKLRGKAASKKGQDTKEDDYRVPRDRGIDYVGQWELGPGRKKR